MLLLLVRHALTPVTGERLIGMLPGYHLSDEGRSQVERLTERLRDVRIHAVYASPIERTVETARPIAAARRLRVRTNRGLAEVGYGTWQGKRLATLARTTRWRALMRRPSDVRFPGGETLRECQARSVAACEAIAAAHPRETVAAVTHADVIRLAVAHYAGIHADLFQRLVVAPASVSALWLGPGGPRLLALNHTGDPAALVPPRVAGGRRSR